MVSLFLLSFVFFVVQSFDLVSVQEENT